MRQTTSTLTTLIAAGALTAFGLALTPTAIAATPSVTAAASSSTASTTSTSGEQRGREGHGPRGVDRPGLETVMRVLNLTAAELAAARDAGSTLAELAEQQGVDVDALIDALVADVEQHMAEHVAAGDVTRDEADERIAEIEQRIADRVNGVQPAEGERLGLDGRGFGERGLGERGLGERGLGERGLGGVGGQGGVGGHGGHGPHGPHGPANGSADDGS